MSAPAFAGDSDTFIPADTDTGAATDTDTDVDTVKDTDTDTVSDTDVAVDTDITVDTGLPYPYGGRTAADLAGEPGGCIGCDASGGAAGASLFAGMVLLGLTRRRRHILGVDV